MKGKILILAIGLVLVAAACNQTENTTDNNQTPSPTPTQTPSPTPAPTPSSSQSPKTVLITMTASGFNPSSLTINKGDTVTFNNQGPRAMWPASAPHPTHTDYPAFDPKKGIEPGQTWSFTFDQTGTWRFHDHLNPTVFGSVTVN